MRRLEAGYRRIGCIDAILRFEESQSEGQDNDSAVSCINQFMELKKRRLVAARTLADWLGAQSGGIKSQAQSREIPKVRFTFEIA
jgi:hypothetical protein